MEPASPQDRQHPQAHALPPIASLTGALPPNEQPNGLQPRPLSDLRDSGNWSSSKHSSGVSHTTGLQLQTILNAEDSPSRSSVPDTPVSARYSGASHNGHNALPSLNQGFDNRTSVDASTLDSRRSSVDSRMNAGMGHLAISPSSPYDGQNSSRVSLVSNLQQQRGITTTGAPTNGAVPLSPLGPRNGIRANQPRRAPVIQPNPRSVSGMPDPTASAPTKGFAWAFPDEPSPEDRRATSSDDSDERSIPSRQNSYAPSINSSIYTTESNLPSGQKRFDDEIPTHHHSMQHRSVSTLQGSDHTATSASGSYSRTPELRVSHKMAERKRRSEMKSLFDELNGILPNSPGSKSSKWEILTKSIEYIRSLARSHEQARAELNRVRPKSDYCDRAVEEMDVLRNELHATWQHLQRIDPNNTHIYGQTTAMFAQQAQQQQPPQQSAPVPQPPQPSNTLPPLQPPPAAQWAPPPPPPTTAMQGVEYR